MNLQQKSLLLTHFLQEEMAARGWDDSDIESRITDPVDQCSVFLAIYVEEEGLVLDQHTAKVLSRLFDVSSDFFINLNKARGKLN